ncbi:sensor histidine kinase [Novosphingobium sp. 9U]|uniref:sensor histidine kinase n=1 Tax=Novosphingobium sp. 9U TaxID=2653158 RepID=UPI0012F43397|nr:histidine kinase [Novosphingobium sp. 9U]VWX53702.1 Histidine kinase [Novosphingobium sp. 9U]
MIDLTHPRVPARLVLASLGALWACYFLVATLRGIFLGLDFVWPIVSRRLTICIISMLVMAALWPVLQLFDRKSFGTRLAVVIIGALPVSLALSFINEAIFADIQVISDHEDAQANVKVSRDAAGNILVDLPPPTPPAPPQPGSTSAPVPPPVPIVTHDEGNRTITINSGKRDGAADGADEGHERWGMIADTAFGRYFLVLAWAAFYFALAKAEEARAAERREGEYRRAAEQAELRSLRYQINPHFLFNTLNSLSALVMTGRHDDAEQMIQTLSTFYRHTLSGDPTNDLALTDEIELQKLYLAIEAVRFPDRLKTEIVVDADVADAMVPGMILQPLVENSVKYAVAATQAQVTITIAARPEGNDLVLTVSDDGPGTSQPGTPGCGIGLSNVRHRLRARFGETARLEFGKPSAGGFRTVVRMPLEHRHD